MKENPEPYRLHLFWIRLDDDFMLVKSCFSSLFSFLKLFQRVRLILWHQRSSGVQISSDSPPPVFLHPMCSISLLHSRRSTIANVHQSYNLLLPFNKLFFGTQKLIPVLMWPSFLICGWMTWARFCLWHKNSTELPSPYPKKIVQSCQKIVQSCQTKK